MNTESVTLPFHMHSGPRFQQGWITHKDLIYSGLPRELRLGLILSGRRDDGKEVVLAYSSINLVDEQGLFLCGLQSIKLWSVKESQKHKKDKEDKLGEIDKYLFRLCPVQNESEREVAKVMIEIESFALPLVYPLCHPQQHRASSTKTITQSNNSSMQTSPASSGSGSHKDKDKDKEKEQLTRLINRDALHSFTPEEYNLLYQNRLYLRSFPRALPHFLLSVKWMLVEQRMEAYRLLTEWTPPLSPVWVLALLDAKYPDQTVREYAVNKLKELGDDQLALYLLQLVQCLKYESYHCSALSQFLVHRAVHSPITIGQPLFWHLKAELHIADHCERFVLILEELLSYCPILAIELKKQAVVVHQLQKASELVQKLKRASWTAPEITSELHKELHRLNTEVLKKLGSFLSPLHPRRRAHTLMVDKCKFMSSKMAPLWIVFRNADPYTQSSSTHSPSIGGVLANTSKTHRATVSVATNISSPSCLPCPSEFITMIFKSGDDLRQDILTLQLLRIMDQLWLQKGIDLRLKPYSCLATGVNQHEDGIGLIEVVLNSQTYSKIQLQFGGAMGALKEKPIDQFIQHHNSSDQSARIKYNQAKDQSSTQDQTKTCYDLAVDNFVRSCAGYCVATCVLGIGDRHNGNIMVTERGHLFHIDFGHFLGNFKKKLGMKRERTAFVFTPEMAYVMGKNNTGKNTNYKQFLDLFKAAFKVLRENATMLEMLFQLMVSAGMPELQSESDINYMREQLYLDDSHANLPDKKIDKKLEQGIDASLKSKYKLIDNLIHNFVHGA